MAPRKKAQTITVPAKAVLDDLSLKRIAFMCEGSFDRQALDDALTQRALTAIALANEEFARAGRGDEYGPAVEKEFAGAGLGVWELDGCVRCLRQVFVNYGLTPPEDRLAVWLKMAQEGLDDLILPDDFNPFKTKPAPADPSPVAAPEVLTSDDLAALGQDNRDMGAIQAAYEADRDLANQMLGEARMASAIGKFASAISFAKLAQVKEHKLYKALPGEAGTWDGFCKALGLSRSKVDEDLLNLRTFGQEAMDALTQAGAGIRQLRALRALPESEREAIAAEAAEAAKAATKEEVLAILEDALDRHAGRVEELEKANADQAADLKAKDQVLADKGKRLDRVEHKLAKLQSLPENEQYRLQLEREKEAVEKLQTTSVEALAGMEKLLAHCEEVLAADVSQHTRTYAEDTVRMLVQSLADLVAKHGINVDVEAVVAPAWAKDAAAAEIKAGTN